MRARAFAILALGSAAVAAPLACVDLFHSTDFETLHVGDAAPDADVATDASAEAGPKPLVDFCKWTSAEAKEHATRACAYLGACVGPLGDTIFGPCMVHAIGAYDCALNPSLRPNGATYALWSCLSDVKTCGDVQTCLGAAASAKCVAVAGGSFTKCAPDSPNRVRVQCSNPQAGPPTAIEPCVLAGKTCTFVDESTSMCTGATTDTCSQGITCSGTSAVDCRVDSTKLVDHGVDCAAFGAGTCVLEGTDVQHAACAPGEGAPPCDGGATVTCDPDGGVAQSCVGGKLVALDCQRLGVGCDATNAPTYDPLQACAERADAGGCIAADDCRQGKVRSCGQGMAFEADCAALGLGPCELIDDGALAHCKAP